MVLTGYREVSREVRVADPWHPHTTSKSRSYWLAMSRVINSILLGIVTYDANLLIIEKKADPVEGRSREDRRAHPRRRQ